jgi:FkbM family methyltransferase
MELRALTPLTEDSSMDAALRRAAAWAPDIGSIIDVGAATGKWTRRALPYFPQASYLLIDPLEERRGALTELQREYPNTDFVIAAAGKDPGEVSLHVASDLDGSGVYDRPGQSSRTVAVTTLAVETKRLALPAPYFIKLDTHGFEVPILEGAQEILDSTSLLMIEAYNFQLSEGCLRFHQLCAWLEQFGFRPCDMVEPLRRARDGVLWQMDLVFARTAAPFFSHTTYH